MKIDYAITEIYRVGDRRSNLSVREICYLRVTEDEKEFGFSELAPLSSWGHPSIHELVSKKDSDLLSRSVELAINDLAARNKRKCLVSNAEQLSNHVLYDLSSDTKINGLRLLKVKIGRDINSETARLSSLLENEKMIRVRIDFNGYFGFAEQFLHWWRKIKFKEQVDFIEDPVLLENEWRLIEKIAPDVNLAADQMLGKVDSKIVVVKPSWEKPEVALRDMDKEKSKIVVTHVLGTELDQAQSIAEALRIRELGWNLVECGLLALKSEFIQRDDKVIAKKNKFGYEVDLNNKDLQWQSL